MFHNFTCQKFISGYFKPALLLLLAFMCRNTFAAAQTDSGSVSAFQFRTVVIDAGHGGKDPGAHGAYSQEKNVALSIALKLRDALQQEMPSLHVVMTRTTDRFVELQERSNIANNAKANLFISIHCNSSPERVSSRNGTLLLIYGYHRKEEQLEALRENASIYQEKDYSKKYDGYKGSDPAYFILLNAFMQKYRAQSIKFGTLLNDEFTERDNRHSEGVKEQGVLVLAHSAMPAVLIETGFINNPAEEKYLNSDVGQREIVSSIVLALKKYKKSFGAN